MIVAAHAEEHSLGGEFSAGSETQAKFDAVFCGGVLQGIFGEELGSACGVDFIRGHGGAGRGHVQAKDAEEFVGSKSADEPALFTLLVVEELHADGAMKVV